MLDFAKIAEGKESSKQKGKRASKEKEDTRFVMLTPTAPQIEPVQKELAQYKPQLAELEKQAKKLEVKDSDTFQVAIDGAGTAKGLIKAINGRKEAITGPYRKFVNQVNTAASFFIDPLKRVAAEFSRKSGDYQYQLELAEAKQKKLIEEESIKLQEKLNKQAAKDNVPAPKVAEVTLPKGETVIHTAGGHSQHLRKQWMGEIEDPEKVPHEYCIPDQKLINQAVRMGVREIPGVKIFEKVSAVHR